MFIAGELLTERGRGTSMLERTIVAPGLRAADRRPERRRSAARRAASCWPASPLLVAACSQLQFGYNNADTVLAYSLDSYPRSERRAGAAGARADCRAAPLAPRDPAARLRAAAQRRAEEGRRTGQRGRRARVQCRRAARAGGDRRAGRARPGEAGADAEAAQVERLAERLANDTSKARRELVRFAGPESLPAARRSLRRAGRELVRHAVAGAAGDDQRLAGRRPEAQEAWMASASNGSASWSR